MRLLLSLMLCFAGCPLAVADSGGGLLVNARIHTVDADAPRAEAMAWDHDGRILAVGSRAALERAHPELPRFDAAGRTVVPGLIDAHAHLGNLGHALLRADLVDAGSKLEVIERLRAFASELPAGAWLLGRGWDQNDWPEQAFPGAAELDAVFPDRPVYLTRIDGHAAWANSAAMRAAQRDLSGDWQPDGGRIHRDADGQPTGIFIDAAMGLVAEAIPAPDAELDRRAIERALAESVKFGLTGVHEAGTPMRWLGHYRRLADAGQLPLRVYAMAPGPGAELEAICAMGHYQHPSGRLSMRALKLYADGALGSRGAALLADYSDEPGQRGLLVTAPEDLESAMRRARDCNVQVNAHAIGDRGNRIVLDLYARLLGEDGAARRWRIEHAQILSPDDIPRFAELGVIASMQPTHATSDMPWAEDRLGADRLFGAYAWRRLLDGGARLAFGSDFPVERVDPMLGLFAAVTRQDREGRPPGGWLPDQRVTPAEALRGFTLDAAYAAFMEDEVGSLEVGKRADFVILDGDPLTVESSRLDDLRVLSTWLDGRAVYRAGD